MSSRATHVLSACFMSARRRCSMCESVAWRAMSAVSSCRSSRRFRSQRSRTSRSASANAATTDLEEIVIQGQFGDAFFVIDEGHVQVEVDAVACQRMAPGEFFGEIALLRDAPRTATVRALGPVRVLTMERDQFLASVGAHPRSAAAAQAVADDRLTGLTTGVEHGTLLLV
jgi:CRP-like cAMP-binding protein